MTNENGCTVVSAPESTTSKTNLKRSLRSSATADADATLMQEEEKLIMDEEVTSVESNDDDDEAERTLLTVALMKSVVDQQHSPGEGGDAAAAAAAAAGVTIVESVVAASGAAATDGDGGGTVLASGGADKPGGSMKQRLRKRRRQSGQDLERLERSQSTNEGGLAKAPVRGPKQTTLSTVRNPPEISISLSVPNPLSVPIPLVAESLSLSTAPPAPPPPSGETSQSTRGNNKLNHIESSSSTPATKAVAAPAIAASAPNFTVPCPLPVASFEPASVIEIPSAVAPAPVSIDAEVEDRRKVNFDESMPRMRGFSIDLDLVGLDLLGGDGPDTGNDHAGEDDDTVPRGRNRAFSFECFAFGINADEPLPPLDQSNADIKMSGGRPRGDSIIFDPVSFQDGGILEQHALERAVSTDFPKKIVKASSSARRPSTSKPTPVPAIALSNAAHLNVDLSTTAVVSTSASSTGNFSPQTLELLNKGGRIGIYLPEARKARIARFHAKRSRRVWRKRIKYDCRKKLADSRPRVKGRFVKRLDNEE